MSTGKSPEEVGVSPGGRGPLALIAGPTASGKSDLAVRLALAHGNAVVINADSAQVYADLQVLSARPTEAEMRGVRHRLFGTWDGARACSAADWAAAARAEVAAAHRTGALPILVGGTGLYIRTLLDGIAPVPAIDPAIREEVRALPVAEAHAALAREDPQRAAVLAPADTTRVARALEVVRSTGHTLSHWQARRAGGIADRVTLAPVVLEADRAWLSRRCDRRFEIMAESGAREEVAALIARDLDPSLPVMRAIGVREIAAWLDGRVDREAAIAAGQLATRQYAKRQATWFRHQLPKSWKRVRAENIILVEQIETLFADNALT
ncbi:tRNA (adenosine(37)-N6)-dimethylallyltransferase MiaA [Tsuneonella sp. YG55]|uniref:tRNA dimethylallyltransferase n=1 Tax=Tsuneonella litorea TaxID=2976475 RepID=A0A9X2VZD7_9SPHN|nr:tRNA (adenosine(37)-N6)-dimethylallyltransferase MiaA [Tsuneonella litorea]MCT2558068.1 tRNA (adenosine(37)-N6)-dimethylallyltransferase MiaA [Tsuneonella litorea]